MGKQAEDTFFLSWDETTSSHFHAMLRAELSPNKSPSDPGTTTVWQITQGHKDRVTGEIFQISSAYWRIVRSEEKPPTRETFWIAIFAQPWGSRYARANRSCVSAYEAKSAGRKHGC